VTNANGLSFVEAVGGGEFVVRYYAMTAFAALTWTAGADESTEVRSKWDHFIDDFSEHCPDALCDAVGNVSLRWCWLVTQIAFVDSAIQGITIALPLAFAVLLLSTMNWIIAICAVFDIVGIMLCELAIMFLLGWKFGVSECVSIVIIIGFSVDYVVHLANAYLESTRNDRAGRLSFALLTMGISVCSGAVTTFSAGFFLVFPEIVFFYKMGLLIMTTVFNSIFWAMCFFTAILAICGPEGDTGDLRKYFKCCRCRREKEGGATEREKERGVETETATEANSTLDLPPNAKKMDTVQSASEGGGASGSSEESELEMDEIHDMIPDILSGMEMEQN